MRSIVRFERAGSCGVAAAALGTTDGWHFEVVDVAEVKHSKQNRK